MKDVIGYRCPVCELEVTPEEADAMGMEDVIYCISCPGEPMLPVYDDPSEEPKDPEL